MLRLLGTVFLIIVASVLYGYFQELNPGSVHLRISPSTGYDLSPAAVVLVSMATGALLVMALVSMRETKNLIVGWRDARLRRKGEKVDALHREGTRAFMSKRTAEAIDLFQKSLALDPNHTDSLLWLGNLYRSEKNYPEAIRLHRKARTNEEHNGEVLLALAIDLEEGKRYEEALQTLQEIIRHDPGNLATLFRMRDLYARLEKWQEALDVQHRLLKAGLSDVDRRAESAVLVGLTYEVGAQLLERGHPEKARRYFRGAIKRDKQFLPGYIGLGETLIREGKTKAAGDILEKAYSKIGNIIILHRLEELYLDQGEPAEIIRTYQEAIQRDPMNPALKFYLGKLYYRLEMVDEAYDLLSVLEGPQEHMADYHKILANLYLRKQHMEGAIDELKKALGFKKRVVVPYLCTRCRHESLEWAGRCGQCGWWNSFVSLPWQESVGPAAPPSQPAPYRGVASPFETV